MRAAKTAQMSNLRKVASSPAAIYAMVVRVSPGTFVNERGLTAPGKDSIARVMWPGRRLVLAMLHDFKEAD